jgi:CBS domain-containing protein
LESASCRTILAVAPTPQKASALSERRLAALLRKAGRQRGIDAESAHLHGYFQAEQMRQPQAVEVAMGAQLRGLIGQLDAACEALAGLETQIDAAFRAHPDGQPAGGLPYAGRVVDIMTSPVVTTSPRMRAVDAALTATLHDVTALPVLEGDELVGMFTTQALLARSAQGDQRRVRVETVMTPCDTQVSPELSLPELATLLSRVDLRSVPVLRDGRLVGIVTEGDLRAVDSSGEDSALEMAR